MLQKFLFLINAVLANFLFIKIILKNKMYHGFHKNMKLTNCFQH